MFPSIPLNKIGVLFSIIFLSACGDTLEKSVPDDFTPDTPTIDDPQTGLSTEAALGKTYYEQADLGCVTCHGATGQGGIGGAIDPSKITYSHTSDLDTDLTLAEYVSDWMPTLGSSPSLCTDECADSIAVYIRTWAETDDEVVNLLPIAISTVDITSGDIPLTVNFDASGSYDTEGTLTYSWSFSDDTSSRLLAPSKTFHTAGNYTATLTVTDSENASTTAEVINITATSPQVNLAPVAVITKNISSGEVPLIIDFDASASMDDNNNITSYSWNFGDNTATDSGLTVSHTYNNVGDYTATLTVTDDAGQSSSITTQITVEAIPDLSPAAAFTVNATAGEAPFTVNFDASGSSDDNGITSYDWDFGHNASTSNGTTSSYTFTDAGTYIATLTVSDSSNQTATVTKTITVTAVDDGTDPVDGNGDTAELIALGKNYFEDTNLGCVSCHGTTGEGGFGGALDPSKTTYNHTSDPNTDLTLAEYVSDWMPTITLAPSLCTGECAESIAAYMRSWADQEVPVNVPPVANATANLTSGEAPLTVLFNASTSTDTEDDTLTYRWEFSDGTSSNLVSLSKTFNDVDNYTATLTVTDSDNASTTADIINIMATSPKVDSAPMANIVIDKSAGEVPLTVAFDGTGSIDDSNIASYSWDFGDNNATDSGQTASHTYDSVGVYTATLFVTDDAGQSSSVTTNITVNAVPNVAPVAIATADKSSGETPLTVQFEASASTDEEGSALTYLWTFNDGTSSNSISPSKIYDTAGNYTAILTVTDADNASTTAEVINITATSPQVNLIPVAVITKNVSSGEVPLIVDFDASASTDDNNNITSYSWNFGDNTATDSGLTVSHTYNTVGDYTATLTVTDDAGQSTSVTTQITVEAIPDLAPVAAFTASATTGEAPFTTNFDASGSSDDNGITSYDWDFGHNASVSNGETSSYTFTDAGTYIVTLTVADSSNQTATVTNTITVTAVDEGNGENGGDTDELIALGKTYFEDSNLGCVSCHGTTGEGGFGGALDPSKTNYNYSSEPSADLTLAEYVSDWMPTLTLAPSLCTGECSDSIAAYIRSWAEEEVPVNVPPVAVATADLTSGDTPLTVQFEASASTDEEGSALTYSWLFSDNTSSTSVSPSKTFNTAGNYTATLTVTDADNASTTADIINITATSPQVDLAPVAVITENTTSGEVPLVVNFNASNSSDDNNITSYNWDFGDGTATDTGLVASHTYDSVGVYTATLTVTDDSGKSTSTTTEITVEEVPDDAPIAAFTINATTGETPFIASFDASDSSDDNGITSYTWDFGSSASIQYGVTSSHTFTEVGTHTITLTVTDSSNQTDTTSQSITVTSTTVTDPDPDDGSGEEELVGDEATGETLYTSMSCALCHGPTGTETLPNTPEIDPTKTTLTHLDAPGTNYTLANYIQEYMPTTNVGGCDAQCAADIASYIATWEVEEIDIATCDIDEIQYGRRQMRLLTSREYENSLQDLLGYDIDAINVGVPSDTLVEDFANQTLTAVTQDYMDAYTSVAAAAATYSFENDFAGVANCTDSSLSQCAEIFIEDFAVRAYRRPLTEDEADRYRAMFTGTISSGSNDEALKIAIQAAISSPYFLYRSEMGRSIAEIQESNENREGDLVPGATSYTLAGSDLSSALNGTDVDGFTEFGLHSYQGFNLSGYTFTGNEIVTVVAKGLEANGSLPTLYLKVGEYVTRRQLTSANENSYTFALSGDDAVTGSNLYVQFANVPNDVSNEQGGTLSIQSITVANAVIAEEPVVELDELLDSDAYVLTAYEVATFIAYTYTGSTPDAALLQAAEDAELSTPAEIQVHIERLMATDKAREHFGEFAAEWLDVDGVLSSSKDAALYPTFTQDIREDMAQEVRNIFMHVMFDENQDIKNIYGDFSFMNKNLADFYGISGPTSDDFVKVDNLVTRGGILTSGAFMANYAHNDETSPIKRAVAVRESLLCQHVPPMPTNLADERDEAQAALTDFLAENDGLITNAEYYGFITKDAPCSACHEEIINPHAFGMEDFDPVGLLRTYGTNGKIIDAMGRLIGTTELDDGNSFDFHGARALSDELKELPAIQSCFAEKSFRFVMATGHDVYNSDSDTSPELSDDEIADYNCALESMTINMSNNNNNAKAAFEAIGLSSLVLYRKQQ